MSQELEFPCLQQPYKELITGLDHGQLTTVADIEELKGPHKSVVLCLNLQSTFPFVTLDGQHVACIACYCMSAGLDV